MKKRKKGAAVVIVILLLAAGGGAGYWYWQNHGSADSDSGEIVYADNVGTLTGTGSATTNKRYAGVVESQETWSVDNSSDKKVAEIYVEEGDVVAVGDKLFTYDTSENEENLIEGEIEIDSYNSQITNYNTQIAELQKDKAKASSDEQLEYQTQIQTIQNQLKLAQYNLQRQQAANESLKKAIENATVYSELAGVVKSINKSTDSSSYSYSDEEQKFITIMALGEYRIKGAISDTGSGDLYEGASVIVYSRVDEDTYWKGTLSSIDYENALKDNNSIYSDSGNTSSKYPFYITLDSMDGLTLGQHVYVEVDYGQEDGKDGMWLSSYYIVQNDGEDAFVWAENDRNRIEKRTVTLGQYDEDMDEYEILGGITSDDYIAYPSDSVTEGAQVEHNEGAMSFANMSSYSDALDSLDTEDWDYETESDTEWNDEEMSAETDTDTEWEDETDTDTGAGDFEDLVNQLDIEEYTESDIGDGSAPVDAGEE